MASISVETLKDLTSSALKGQKIPESIADKMAEEFVIAEIAGIKTHGVGKLVSLNLGDLSAEPIITYSNAVISVNGNGGNGFILFDRVSDLLIEHSKKFGIAASFVTNHSRYSSLYPYTSKLAENGLVGILTNSAGPAAVAPFGSIDPVTGTNPLCFSFPTASGNSHTFDFSTAEVVWGEIRQATLEERKLKAGAFIDNDGNDTEDPSKVNAVKAFGGAKGWALNLALEIIAGSLAKGKTGLKVDSEFDCGATMIAIDPTAIGIDLSTLSGEISELFKSIRSSRPASLSSKVRVPGDRGRSNIEINKHLDDNLDVPDTTLKMLRRMSDGESVAELSNNPLFN